MRPPSSCSVSLPDYSAVSLSPTIASPVLCSRSQPSTIASPEASRGAIVPSQQKGRRKRADVFAQWIVDNLPLPPLENQRYILDVAGGHGVLSFLLREKHGRRCIVIDPREDTGGRAVAQVLRLSKRERRRLKEIGQRPVLEVEQSFDWFDANFTECESELLQGADAIVGMHPDQATEHNYCALLYGLPIDVVPCCVFPQLAPHRRLPDGKTVT